MTVTEQKTKVLNGVKHVTKRDGRIVGFDFEKIEKTLAYVTVGLDIEFQKLIQAVKQVGFSDKVCTSEIIEQLLFHCISQTSIENADYRILAGRLLMLNGIKEAERARGYKYGSFLTHVQHMVEKKIYDEKILSIYSQEELKEAGSWLDTALDLKYDYAGAVLIINRYLSDFELLQEAYLMIALLMASVEKEGRLGYAKGFYEMLAQKKISLATPILLNLRRVNGNLSSCFIIAVDDDLESIFASIAQVAKISKCGGGVGVNLSKVRAKGSWVHGSKNASGGVVPWIKIVNDTAVAVNQMGKRAGAVTVSLDIWHLDIEDFLELQTENGDQRRKAYDIFPQVVIPDHFMQCLQGSADWHLFDPYEVKRVLKIDLSALVKEKFVEGYETCKEAFLDKRLKLAKVISAKTLFKQIMRAQLETGMPYLFFKDTANADNPNSHEGYIPAGNLCMESFSNVKANEEVHTCNLLSLNLANIDEKEICDVCGMAVRMLDNTIDLTITPSAQSNFHNKKYRTIGIGAMGLVDYLAKRDVAYEKGKRQVAILFEEIAYFSIKASIGLAKKRGSFLAYKGSSWDTGQRVQKYYELSENKERWEKLKGELKKYGIRNSQISAIAPNTSSALVQGCSASVLPIFSKFYFDKNAKGAVPVCPPYIKEKLWYYKEYRHMDILQVNKIIAEIQKWTDTGISYELMFDLNNEAISAKRIYECIVDAWGRKIKTIYYVRTIQKDGSSIEKSECASCAN